MKKVLALLFLLTSLCFGNGFKSYEAIKFFECVEILNELNKDYLILSYKILPTKTSGFFNMIVEIEKIEEIN